MARIKLEWTYTPRQIFSEHERRAKNVCVKGKLAKKIQNVYKLALGEPDLTFEDFS